MSVSMILALFAAGTFGFLIGVVTIIMFACLVSSKMDRRNGRRDGR